jgi:hypothetical protein
MKKLLVLMMVLGIAGAANAALLISVDGVVDPPDSEIEIMESDWVTLDIWGDGQTDPSAFLMGLELQGPASLDLANTDMIYTGSDASVDWLDYPDIADLLGVQNPLVLVSLNDIPPPGTDKAPLDGTLVDGIRLHCDGPGEVVVLLYDFDGNLLDSQVIHQIVPEPMTLGLLGLGGLFLRRRK